jgi:type IV secretory pathway TrbL component
MTFGFCGVIKEAEDKEELIARLIGFFLYVPFIIWLIFN